MVATAALDVIAGGDRRAGVTGRLFKVGNVSVLMVGAGDAGMSCSTLLPG